MNSGLKTKTKVIQHTDEETFEKEVAAYLSKGWEIKGFYCDAGDFQTKFFALATYEPYKAARCSSTAGWLATAKKCCKAERGDCGNT